MWPPSSPERCPSPWYASFSPVFYPRPTTSELKRRRNSTSREKLPRRKLYIFRFYNPNRIIARLKLQGGATQDEAALRAALQSDRNNLEARFNLAQALAGNAKYEEALKEFLTIVKADRNFRDDGARMAIIQIFEVLGSDHELVEKYRSEL